MKIEQYSKLWLVLVNIKAKEGFAFEDLIDFEDKPKEKYLGAWANILVEAETINEALDITPRGLDEQNFQVEFISKIENLESLVEHQEISEDVIEEADWLLQSNFVFKISDKLFPYSSLEE